MGEEGRGAGDGTAEGSGAEVNAALGEEGGVRLGAEGDAAEERDGDGEGTAEGSETEEAAASGAEGATGALRVEATVVETHSTSSSVSGRGISTCSST